MIIIIMEVNKLKCCSFFKPEVGVSFLSCDSQAASNKVVMSHGDVNWSAGFIVNPSGRWADETPVLHNNHTHTQTITAVRPLITGRCVQSWAHRVCLRRPKGSVVYAEVYLDSGSVGHRFSLNTTHDVQVELSMSFNFILFKKPWSQSQDKVSQNGWTKPER